MIEIRANIDPLIQRFAALSRQIPFATSRAINFTLNDIQAAERERLRGAFTLRRPQFIEQTIKIGSGDRATKAKLIGTVRVDPERDFLAKFEAGGAKQARGGGSLAVPAEALRRKRSDVIPAALRPKALQLKLHRTRGGKVQFKGERRTFIVEKSTFSYGILQRRGRGAGSRVVVLYWFQRAVALPPALRFEATARRVTAERFQLNFNRALDDAIRTAR